MKKFITYSVCLMGILPIASKAQNIYSGERVQLVGSFQGYTTTPYGTDYRTTTFRRVSVSTGTPLDGRGQWVTTINVQSAGGDVLPINMLGGSGSGFLFITGPVASAFQNKWAFNGKGQGVVDGVNDVVYNGSTDMGLDMSTPGYYSFAFNDCGYSGTNAKYYVGRTDAMPVSVMRMSEMFVGSDSMKIMPDTAIQVNIMTSGMPSPQENIYIRYISNVAGDFSGKDTSVIVQAMGNGMAYSAIIPFNVKYYVFTSTASLANLTAASNINRSLATINFDDNQGQDYVSPKQLPIAVSSFSGSITSGGIRLNWETATEINASGFDIEKNTGSWKKVGAVAALNKSTGSTYSFIDNSIGASNNYRLKLVDKDGNFSYSKVVSVKAPASKENLSIYPTITRNGSFYIRLNQANAGNVTIKVVALNGKLIQSTSFNANAGVSILPYTIKAATKGNYIVRVETASDKKAFKVIIE